MERHKDTTESNSSLAPFSIGMKSSERIQFLANLIVDRIIEDQQNNNELLQKIKSKV